jgi:photosystem II stability/assembly factor-like uncharacterized protein
MQNADCRMLNCTAVSRELTKLLRQGLALLATLTSTLLGQVRQDVSTGTTASLRGLSVSGNAVWASGQRGTVIRSTDGGLTWALASIADAASSDVRAIHARSASVAHAASTNGRIWRSIDGGRTWSLRYQASDTSVFLDAIAFYDDRRGLALGDPIGGHFFILVTTDGGETWREALKESRPEAVAGEAAFAASGSSLVIVGNRAWIGTGGAATRVYYSDDAGRHWRAAAVPLASGAPSKGIFSLSMVDFRRGIAVGGDYQQADSTRGNAAVTGDGGRTWRPASVAPRGYRSGVSAARRSGSVIAVATGTNGTDVSRDGGLSWLPLDSLGFNAVQFTSAGIAVAVGGGGRVARFDVRTTAPRH